MSYKRILVPVDFSADSLHALEVAAREFASLGSSLVLLHVFEPPMDARAATPYMSREHLQMVSRAQAEGGQPADPAEIHLQQLKNLAAPLTGAWKELQTVVRTGQPTDRIIEAAEQEGVDLVIMGSHGIGGLGKMLFGSTTYDVARKVKCAVLISKRS